MSAFGHAGFGSSNRRNQLRAQGQIGADTYGQGVRNAMQAPTMNIYSAPQEYQQATGQTAQQQPSAPAAKPASQPSMNAYSPPPSPGRAQPIQPQSQGTPHQSQNTADRRGPAGDKVFSAKEAMDALLQNEQARQAWGGGEFFDSRQQYLEDALANFGGGDWRQGVRDYYSGLIGDTAKARDEWQQWGDANKGGTGGGLTAGLSQYDQLMQQYNDALDAFNQRNPQTGGGYPLPNPPTGGGYPLPAPQTGGGYPLPR